MGAHLGPPGRATHVAGPSARGVADMSAHARTPAPDPGLPADPA